MKRARQRRELHVLEGMLPICGFCKRIREASGEWRQLEHYRDQHQRRICNRVEPD